MRSADDCATQTPDQLFQAIAKLLATSIVRLHARGILCRADPHADPSENPSKNGQDCLE